MGDSLREAAFDVAYGILDDVGDAEDCASEALARADARWANDGQVPDRETWVLDQAANAAMAKTRRSPARQWRRVLVLGAGAAVLFLLAVGVVFARNGGTVSPTLHAAGAAPFASVEETTPPTQGTTTTTVVLLQPPIVTVPAPVTAPSTATTAGVARRTTVASAPVAKAPLLPTATLAEVWPPSRDAARVYVSGRGSDADSYVSRMTVDWGDGSVVTNLDYPLSSCHDVPSNQAADTNHGYAVPGRYTVRLIVTSVGCDGTGAQTATAETTVTYPAPSPTG